MTPGGTGAASPTPSEQRCCRIKRQTHSCPQAGGPRPEPSIEGPARWHGTREPPALALEIESGPAVPDAIEAVPVNS